jgi:nucleotide-binding universal stress UspA family protein
LTPSGGCVVVGTTLTPAGDRVIEAGADLARVLGTGVRLAHVLHPRAGAAEREERARRLRGAAEALENVDVEVDLRDAADPSAVLLELERGGAVALVVGAHESAGTFGKRLGATTTRLVRRSHGPLLVVRGRCAIRGGSAPIGLPLERLAAERGLATRPLPRSRGWLGRWRRFRVGRLVAQLATSVLLVPEGAAFGD